MSELGRRVIFRGNGELVVGHASRFDDEASLHTAIAAQPHVLPTEQIGLGLLAPLGTEVNFGHGPIDLLAADASGRLVIIEFKRGTESADIRKVVAQMLDYGSSIWRRTDYAGVERACQKGKPGFTETLATRVEQHLAVVDGTPFDASRFSQGVEDSIDSGDFVFIYVGRTMGERTRRVMSYLSEGPRLALLGIEVDYFRSPSGIEMLAPRVAFSPSWVDAQYEATGRGAAPLNDQFEVAITAVRELRDGLDLLAAEYGYQIADSKHHRKYQPATGGSALNLNPSSGRLQFGLAPFRVAGDDKQADEFAAILEEISGSPVPRDWPSIDAVTLMRDWEATREILVVPYFIAREELKGLYPAKPTIVERGPAGKD